MKFGRIYSMFAQGRVDDHTIDFPLTCRFRVINNSLFSCGSAVFQIYNLSEDTRNDLYKDPYEQFTYKQIIFAGGYQIDSSNGGAITLPIIFRGNITQAYSYRQGPDWITEIQALDGGFAIDNGSINLTKPTPYSFENMLSDAVSAMPNVKLGVIGAFEVDNSRGLTFMGNPWDLITQRMIPLLGRAFINKETVNIVRQWEYIEDEGQLETISAETGMIGTPQIQSALVRARMIFEPRLEIFQRIQLKTANSRMSGDYIVYSLTHAGTISGAVCEELATEVSLFRPEHELVAVAA